MVRRDECDDDDDGRRRAAMNAGLSAAIGEGLIPLIALSPLASAKDRRGDRASRGLHSHGRDGLTMLFASDVWCFLQQESPDGEGKAEAEDKSNLCLLSCKARIKRAVRGQGVVARWSAIRCDAMLYEDWRDDGSNRMSENEPAEMARGESRRGRKGGRHGTVTSRLRGHAAPLGPSAAG